MARITRFQLVLFAIEFSLAVTTWALFCSAYPDHYRTTLWSIGGEKGWNSNPRLRIYFYANHREPPEIPLIWSQRLTTSNLAVATLTIAVCLIKAVVSYFDVVSNVINLSYDALLAAFWTYAVVSQSSSDLTDTDHLSIRPWYLERSCRDVEDVRGATACSAGKASFAFALISMIFYFVRLTAAVLHLAYMCGYNQIFETYAQRFVPTLSRSRHLADYTPIPPEEVWVDESTLALRGFGVAGMDHLEDSRISWRDLEQCHG